MSGVEVVLIEYFDTIQDKNITKHCRKLRHVHQQFCRTDITDECFLISFSVPQHQSTTYLLSDISKQKLLKIPLTSEIPLRFMSHRYHIWYWKLIAPLKHFVVCELTRFNSEKHLPISAAIVITAQIFFPFCVSLLPFFCISLSVMGDITRGRSSLSTRFIIYRVIF